MSPLQKYLPLALVVIAVGVATGFQGYYTERWMPLADAAELKLMADRMKDIPLEFGSWKGVEQDHSKNEIMLEQYERAQVAGHSDRIYRNSVTGKQVRISLVVGHYRHVVIHVPTQCWVGNGYKMIDEERPELVGKHEFRTAEFQKETQKERIMWAWSRDGQWVGPESRRGLSRHVYYKLYIITEGASSFLSKDEKTKVLPKDFLDEFLPVINAALFPKPAEDATTSET